MKTVGVRMEEGIYRRLVLRAAEENISVSEATRRALESWIGDPALPGPREIMDKLEEIQAAISMIPTYRDFVPEGIPEEGEGEETPSMKIEKSEEEIEKERRDVIRKKKGLDPQKYTWVGYDGPLPDPEIEEAKGGKKWTASYPWESVVQYKAFVFFRGGERYMQEPEILRKLEQQEREKRQ